PKPNCTNCPAFLTRDRVQDKLKRSIGSSMCGRYGIPLDRPNVTDTKVVQSQHEHFAGKCDAYGQPMPSTMLERRLTVALPMPELRKEGLHPQLVTSCNGCANFIPADVVAERMGWTTGMCAAKGKLILSNS